ncbi:heme oxygenase (biliverdin-producing) [Prochlorococcus marinus]|uniref:biliverdin-producing heme oxygenase n=1 Tax=Prochlorococcus marinus TaxID=1219 RepID=UPI0022B53332|nr:heme oxygenase (biliverdin-producing) [Prochlorococcus marinus]
MAVALARQLREGTKKSHTMAENTGFISCFLKGVVDKSSYRNLLADLYLVYSAMEEEIEKLCANSHPIISPIGFKELFRKEKLEQDLSFYFGSKWSELAKPSKPAVEYEARIREIAKENPELLIGHHYSRYIGDLSGGQLLKTITKKAMNLAGDEGLSFYIFEEIRDEKEFKIKYRNTLDNLPIDQKMADSIIEEANRSFKYNMDIFNELEGNLIAAIGKVLFRFFANKERKGSTE